MYLPLSLLIAPALIASSQLAHALPGAAAPAPQAGLAQQEVRDLLSLRVEHLGGVLRHPKDAGLARVFALLDERLAELPAEVEGAPPIDPAWIGLVTELCTSAKTLRLGLKPGASLTGRDVPFYGRLELNRPDAASASALEARLLEVLRQLGAPELPAANGGLRLLPDTPVPVRFGVQGDAVVLDMDAPASAPLTLGDPLLPANAATALTLALDYGPLLQLALEGARAEDPTAAGLLQQVIERLGLDQLRLHLAAACDGDRSYTVMRMPGFGQTLVDNGLAGTTTLTPAELALVPQDATWASVGKANFIGLFDLVLDLATEALAAQGMEGDPLEMVAGMTGFHLREDFVSLLGDTCGMYASDTTGGGGLMSMVLFVSLRDAEHAVETRGQLSEILNGLAQLHLQGYMQLREWSRDGVEYSTMTFPGLPVPVEPTIAITDSWIFVGATSGAALEAVRQARGKDRPNLLDRRDLQEQLPGGIAGLQSLTFQDSARLVRDGYSAMRMVSSALANGVRSRRDGMRDAGEVLPPFHELVQGVKATVSTGRMQGADWVVESRGDASLVVQMTALCGWVQSNGLMLALPAVFLGARQTEAMAMEPVYSDF